MIGFATLELANGQQVQIPCMTLTDFEILAEDFYQRDRRKVLSDMEAIGASVEIKATALRELRGEQYQPRNVVTWECLRPTSAIKIIKHCAAKLNGSAPDIDSEVVDPEKACRLACTLAHRDFEETARLLNEAVRSMTKTGDAIPEDADHPDDLIPKVRPQMAATG